MSQVLVSDSILAAYHIHDGIALFKANRFADAIAEFDRALRYTPDDPYARYNRATALLSLGDYARGFHEYDVTWRLFHWRGFGPVGNDIDRVNMLPRWHGERDVNLLLYHEMGFGDAIMALRFLPELQRRCEATLVIDQCLARLAEGFVDVTTMVPDDLRPFDCRLPLFAIMSAMDVTEHSIPAAPYINVPQCTLQGRRIGIAWSGRTQTAFTLERFLELLAPQDFELHSLQPGPVAAMVDHYVKPLPPGSDFADVADIIARMDHIVSVDTAAIHLAGAMGHKSAHLVLPYLSDWRWWHTERWYPQLHTYRQDNAADWSAPFARLKEALR